jgi:hypothetical protein
MYCMLAYTVHVHACIYKITYLTSMSIYTNICNIVGYMDIAITGTKALLFDNMEIIKIT